MASLREYFDTDLNMHLSSHVDWQLQSTSNVLLPPIRARISMDFNANAKYWSFYIPNEADVPGYVNAIFSANETSQCVLLKNGDPVCIETGFPDSSERTTSMTLVFTQRIILYIDTILSPEVRQWIIDLGGNWGFHILIRDHEYAMKRSENEKPLAFISHDTRDKEPLVRELAVEMIKLMCPVWYDEFSLMVGDSLRSNIERGLKEASKCVVIFSPNFFSNEGWGKAEFDSIFTREILEKNNIILPVWHNVDVREVFEYSPRLADRVSLSSALGPRELAKKLVNAIKYNQQT